MDNSEVIDMVLGLVDRNVKSLVIVFLMDSNVINVTRFFCLF
jgi:hypothetical protein